MISSGQDLIGCITEPVDFVAGGTCEEQLMGMCETLWEPKMKPDQLFECISQVLLHVYDLDNRCHCHISEVPPFPSDRTNMFHCLLCRR